MKFGKVPEEAIAARPWAEVVTIGPPPGYDDGSIGSLQAQIDEKLEDFPDGRAYRIFVELEEGDRESLLSGSPIEFALFGYRMQPVGIQIWNSDPDQFYLQLHNQFQSWLARKTADAIVHHAAGGGNGHQPEDRCESWYALQESLTHMHADSWSFIKSLFEEAKTTEEQKGNNDVATTKG